MEGKPVGEPIKLYKGKDSTTAYGPAAMGALLRDGWQTEPPASEGAQAAMLPDAPAMDAAPEGATVATKKRVGEYGAGAGTQRVVDKTKLSEVKQERAKDRKDGTL